MWTRTPPTKPGCYLCRFLPALGVDRDPFEVNLSSVYWAVPGLNK